MKKLLIMASLFWPQKKSGGPPISLYNLVNGIKDQFEIYVVSKNHEIGEVDPLPGIESGWNRFVRIQKKNSLPAFGRRCGKRRESP